MTDAMRDADGREVFVRENGEYATSYPSENVVRRGEDADLTVFEVYAFIVETDREFEEQSWTFTDEDEALEFATELYGADVTSVADHEHNSPPHKAARRFERDGEISEVEVHERPADFVAVPSHHLNELMRDAANNEQLVNGEWPGDSHRSRELTRTIEENLRPVEE